jgi:ubiquinone/menaquinone biosynthesis C-methylase UbiE
MRKRFAELLPGILCTAGTAEATLLPESSVDLITAAQAFHWFDEEKFKSEAKRILRPNGKVAIIWNTSLKNAFTIARDEICKKYCPRFRSGYAGKRTPAEGDNFLRYIYFQKVEFLSFANPFEMTPEIFEGNMRSRSYMPAPGDDTFEACMEEPRSVFERFAVNGKVTEEVETQIFLGEFTP